MGRHVSRILHYPPSIAISPVPDAAILPSYNTSIVATNLDYSPPPPSPRFRRRTPSLPQGSAEAEVPPLAAPSSFGSSFGSVDDLRSHVCLT
jgi:hypothetical protein